MLLILSTSSSVICLSVKTNPTKHKNVHIYDLFPPKVSKLMAYISPSSWSNRLHCDSDCNICYLCSISTGKVFYQTRFQSLFCSLKFARMKLANKMPTQICGDPSIYIKWRILLPGIRSPPSQQQLATILICTPCHNNNSGQLVTPATAELLLSHHMEELEALAAGENQSYSGLNSHRLWYRTALGWCSIFDKSEYCFCMQSRIK